MPFNNLDSTAAQIARMTPQQRQQFAQMHKTDPIMMSLVSFVQNQDEAMRSAQMAKMTGQEPPKVVDQVINSINPPPQAPQVPQGGQQGMPQGAPQAAQQLPENTGIAALPAPNMQNMAEGGITEQDPEAGFVGDEGVTRLDDGKLAQEYQRAKQSGNSARAEAIKNELDYRSSRFKKYMADGGMTNDLYVPDDSDARMGNGGYNFPQGEAVIRMAEGTPEEMFTKQQDEDRQLADFDAASKLYEMENRPKPAPQTMQQRPMPQRPMPRPTAAPTAEEYQAQFKQLQGRPEDAVSPFAAQEKALSEREQAASQTRLRQFEEENARLGLARKGQEERIGKRESELAKVEDKNSGLALLQAGLAMMQSKGRGLAGIAEGAGVGLNVYKSGMDKIASAKEKIDEARDQIEQYRRNEDMLSGKEKRAILSDIEDKKIKAEERMLGGAQTAFKLSREEATKAVDLASRAAISQQDNAIKLEAARIGQQPAAMVQVLTALGKGDIGEGFKIYNAQKTEIAEPKQQLAELRNLQKTYADQASHKSGLSKEQRKVASDQLNRINAAIEAMAFPNQAPPPPGNRPPLSAFMK